MLGLVRRLEAETRSLLDSRAWRFCRISELAMAAAMADGAGGTTHRPPSSGGGAPRRAPIGAGGRAARAPGQARPPPGPPAQRPGGGGKKDVSAALPTGGSAGRPGSWAGAGLVRRGSSRASRYVCPQAARPRQGCVRRGGRAVLLKRRRRRPGRRGPRKRPGAAAAGSPHGAQGPAAVARSDGAPRLPAEVSGGGGEGEGPPSSWPRRPLRRAPSARGLGGGLGGGAVSLPPSFSGARPSPPPPPPPPAGLLRRRCCGCCLVAPARPRRPPHRPAPCLGHAARPPASRPAGGARRRRCCRRHPRGVADPAAGRPGEIWLRRTPGRQAAGTVRLRRPLARLAWPPPPRRFYAILRDRGSDERLAGRRRPREKTEHCRSRSRRRPRAQEHVQSAPEGGREGFQAAAAPPPLAAPGSGIRRWGGGVLAFSAAAAAPPRPPALNSRRETQRAGRDLPGPSSPPPCKMRAAHPGGLHGEGGEVSVNRQNTCRCPGQPFAALLSLPPGLPLQTAPEHPPQGLSA